VHRVVKSCHHAVLQLDVPFGKSEIRWRFLVLLVHIGAIAEDSAQLSKPELLVGRCVVAKLVEAGLLGRHCQSLDSVLHDLAADVDSAAGGGGARLVQAALLLCNFKFDACDRALLCFFVDHAAADDVIFTTRLIKEIFIARHVPIPALVSV